jgi:hypothetical protein
MNQDTTQPSFLLSILPLLFVGIIFAAIVFWLAPRKGQSQLWALAVFVPCIGPLVIIYLLSLTDKKLLDEIAELKSRIDKQ